MVTQRLVEANLVAPLLRPSIQKRAFFAGNQWEKPGVTHDIDKKWIANVHLFELLAYLDKWVPSTFSPTARAHYGSLELLAFHVIPRLVKELRERDQKGFGFYMGVMEGLQEENTAKDRRSARKNRRSRKKPLK